MMRRRLTSSNAVRGCPGWFYGLLVSGGRTVEFDVHRLSDRAEIKGLRGSGYRTTTLARSMGVKDLKGYQHVAVEAIRTYEREEQ
jgi:hypothetical protein